MSQLLFVAYVRANVDKVLMLAAIYGCSLSREIGDCIYEQIGQLKR